MVYTNISTNIYRMDNIPIQMFFVIWMQEDIVLCKIYRKATSLKVMEQRAAMEGESRMPHLAHSFSSPPIQESFSSSYETHQSFGPAMPAQDIVLKAEEEAVLTEEEQENKTSCLATEKVNLTELQLPKLNTEWTADPLWTLLRSPLLDNMSPYPMW